MYTSISVDECKYFKYQMSWVVFCFFKCFTVLVEDT